MGNWGVFKSNSNNIETGLSSADSVQILRKDRPKDD